MLRYLKLMFLCLMPGLSLGQSGLIYNTDQALESYTLFNVNARTYLVDQCGKWVHQWLDIRPSYHCKLLPDGHLIYIQNNTIYELDWEGNEVYSIENPVPDTRLEYEVIKLPGGNFLALGRKSMTEQEFLDLGFDLSNSRPDQVDVVIELDPETEELVWMWNIADHTIQERDTSLVNYGIIRDNPQLLNVNAISTFDWTFEESFMVNSLDYNSELDQIALSVRKMGEVVIIDHSTTTAEASGSTGGQYGKGGDILYRWGNPQNYNRGDQEDQQLYFQHNPNWIEHGPHKGKLIVYNNGLGRTLDGTEPYSSAPIIDTPVDADGSYMLDDSLAFLPLSPDLELGYPDPDPFFYSPYTSGAELLSNGNIFITSGLRSRLSEYTPEGELVWEYVVPNNTYIYRAEKYRLDYPAFEGKDLTPFGLVPGTDNPFECDVSVSIDDLQRPLNIEILHPFGTNELTVFNTDGLVLNFQLYDIKGILVNEGVFKSNQIDLTLDFRGIGFLKLFSVKKEQVIFKLFVR